MIQYLMTHSLLGAWLRSMKDNPFEEDDDQLDKFMHVLRREKTPPTDAMQNGIYFENLVTGILTDTVKPELDMSGPCEPNTGEAMESIKFPKWYNAACKVADMIRGAKLQYVAKKPVVIDGMELLLYGRLDAMKEGRIFDIKYSGSYERGKYRDSTQHPMYHTLVPEIMNFTYIVSDGHDVWTEVYWYDEIPRIEPVIVDFLRWLRDMNLMETYKQYWGALR